MTYTIGRSKLCSKLALDRTRVETKIDEKLVILVRVAFSDVFEVSRPLHDGVSHSMSVDDIFSHAQDVFVQTSNLECQERSYISVLFQLYAARLTLND